MTTASLRVIQSAPTLREMTADTLREAIFSMHFKPNDRLVERDLCDQTGVSRTCVREALRHLESEGLVERRANKGLYVTAVTPAEALQIYEVRAALEPALARLFVERASEADVKALRRRSPTLEQPLTASRYALMCKDLKSSMTFCCGEAETKLRAASCKPCTPGSRTSARSQRPRHRPRASARRWP